MDLRRQKPKGPGAPEAGLDRLPPRAEEAEAAVIACVLSGGEAALDECVLAIGEDGSAFYDLRNRTLYQTAVELSRKGPCGPAEVVAELKSRGLLEQVGGVSYVFGLAGETPSPAAVGYFLEAVADAARLRAVIRACVDGAAAAYEPGPVGRSLEVLAKVEADLGAARGDRKDRETPVKDLVVQAVARYEQWMQTGGKALDGISTGLPDVDRVLNGLRPSDMTVLAGFPSTGKTAMALQWLVHAAVRGGTPGVMFSLEMPARDLVSRAILSEARVNASAARRGEFNQADFPKMTRASAELSKAPVHFVEAYDMEAGQLRSSVRSYVRRHGVKLVVVDYLQLLTAAGATADETRQGEVARISRCLKGVAMETGVHLVALSQLNDDGKLRESRAIGQDADNVLVLERGGDEGEVRLHVRKQRNGEAGVAVPLTFVGGYTRFESAARVDGEEGY